MFKGGERLWASARLFTATDSADPTTEEISSKPRPGKKERKGRKDAMYKLNLSF